MNASQLITAGISGVSFLSSVITCIQWVFAIIEEKSFHAAITSVWFYITLSLLLLAVIFYYLLKKISSQRILIERLINETNKQINESIVSQLYGHPLVFSHLKYQVSKFYSNNIDLSLFCIKNTIESNAETRKDSVVEMNLEGIFTAPSYCFRFIITGQSIVNAEELHMEAFDLIKNERLLLDTDNIGSKNDIREFRISYKTQKKIHEPLHIVIKWRWPQMLELKDDFITLPNYFSETTASIRMVLEKNQLQDFSTVSIFKYTPCMKDAQHICDVELQPDGKTFCFELDNPDMRTDYIMYYK